MSLEKFNDEELRAELKRREEKRALDERLRRNRRADEIKRLITICPTAIALIAPEHGRTSCSDSDLVNGWGSNGYEYSPRCNRCALLQALRDSYWDPDFALEVMITRLP